MRDRSDRWRGRMVNASEIGTYLYCRRAWRFQQQGAASAREPERALGTAYHAQHGRQVGAARRSNAVARWCLALCALFLILAVLQAFR